jgi:hypothetical protein
MQGCSLNTRCSSPAHYWTRDLLKVEFEIVWRFMLTHKNLLVVRGVQSKMSRRKPHAACSRPKSCSASCSTIELEDSRGNFPSYAYLRKSFNLFTG